MSAYIKQKLDSIPMTVTEALKIVSPSPFNRHMIKALSICPMLNTEEEWKRLKAAKLVEANKKNIKYVNAKIGYVVD